MVYTQHYKIDKFIISTLLLTNHFQICYKLSFDKRKGAWLHWFRCRTRRSKTYATPCRRKGRRPLFLVFYIFTFRYCKNKSLRLSDAVSLKNKDAKYTTAQQQQQPFFLTTKYSQVPNKRVYSLNYLMLSSQL